LSSPDFDLIARFCNENPQAVLWDQPSASLRDVFSGKTLRLARGQVREVVAQTASDTGEPYLVVLLDDGRQIALARAGIAFPPDLRNAGPLPGMPVVVCWRDYAQVAGVIEHALSAHPDTAPGRELLDLLRYCIALLDGARRAGFEVAPEERRIEGALAEVERRVGGRLS